MKNPSKYIYQCCTHYREKGYDDGYIMLPIFRVKVCRNCGEYHAVWGTAANILFMGLFPVVLGWKGAHQDGRLG